MVKVLICGDRHWTNYNSILDVVRRLKAKYGDVLIIEGEAPGADTLAMKAAIQLNLPVKGFPVDWKKYGNSAGPRRNQQMLDENPDISMVIAFHPDMQSSRGTRDMIARAKVLGIKTYLFQK